MTRAGGPAVPPVPPHGHNPPVPPHSPQRSQPRSCQHPSTCGGGPLPPHNNSPHPQTPLGGFCQHPIRQGTAPKPPLAEGAPPPPPPHATPLPSTYNNVPAKPRVTFNLQSDQSEPSREPHHSVRRNECLNQPKSILAQAYNNPAGTYPLGENDTHCIPPNLVSEHGPPPAHPIGPPIVNPVNQLQESRRPPDIAQVAPNSSHSLPRDSVCANSQLPRNSSMQAGPADLPVRHCSPCSHPNNVRPIHAVHPVSLAHQQANPGIIRQSNMPPVRRQSQPSDKLIDHYSVIPEKVVPEKHSHSTNSLPNKKHASKLSIAQSPAIPINQSNNLDQTCRNTSISGSVGSNLDKDCTSNMSSPPSHVKNYMNDHSHVVGHGAHNHVQSPSPNALGNTQSQSRSNASHIPSQGNIPPHGQPSSQGCHTGHNSHMQNQYTNNMQPPIQKPLSNQSCPPSHLQSNHNKSHQIQAIQGSANQVLPNQSLVNKRHPNHAHPSQQHPSQQHPNPGHPSQGYPSQGHPNQGHAKLGYLNQAHPNQAHPNQAHPNHAHPNQAHPNQAHHNKGHPIEAHPNQGHAKLGYPNQGHFNQGHPNQRHSNQGHPNQGNPNQGHPNQGHPNQGYPNQGHLNQRHPNQGHPNQAHPNQGHPNHGHPSQAHPSQAHPSQAHPNQAHPNQGHSNQAHPSQALPSQALPSQAHPSQAHPSLAHPSQAHPSQAHPSQAHPSQAHPSQAHPSQAHSNQELPNQGYPNQGHSKPCPPSQGLLNQGHANESHPNLGHSNQNHSHQEHYQMHPYQGHPIQGRHNQDLPKQGMPTRVFQAPGHPNQGPPNHGQSDHRPMQGPRAQVLTDKANSNVRNPTNVNQVYSNHAHPNHHVMIPNNSAPPARVPPPYNNPPRPVNGAPCRPQLSGPANIAGGCTTPGPHFNTPQTGHFRCSHPHPPGAAQVFHGPRGTPPRPIQHSCSSCRPTGPGQPTASFHANGNAVRPHLHGSPNQVGLLPCKSVHYHPVPPPAPPPLPPPNYNNNTLGFMRYNCLTHHQLVPPPPLKFTVGGCPHVHHQHDPFRYVIFLHGKTTGLILDFIFCVLFFSRIYFRKCTSPNLL